MADLRAQLQPMLDRAMTLQQAGNFAHAEQIYGHVLKQDPTHPEAMHRLGLLRYQMGQIPAALEWLRRAVNVDPKSPTCHISLAAALRDVGQFDEAIASAKAAHELASDLPAATIELAATLHRAGEFKAAEQVAQEGLVRWPESAALHGNLANALFDQGKVEESLEPYRRAVELAPHYQPVINNYGNALRLAGRFGEAEPIIRRAIEMAPHMPDGHINLAMILLTRGDMEHGWAEYEWCNHLSGVLNRQVAAPLWKGEDLSGKTILLIAEQGFGDTIQYLRYARLLHEQRGVARVVLECLPPIATLFETADGVDEVVVRGAPLPKVDAWLPMTSLPHRFGTTLATVPADAPYLHPNPARAARWRSELKLSADMFNVGLVWAGNPGQKNDRNRSSRLADFAPLAQIVGLRFVSLQLDEPAKQLFDPPTGMKIDDASPAIRNFADTAALLAELDLLIGVETAPAHLAGALARPVWTLHPFLPDWRWMFDREDSPWYPTMRLFRQKSPGDWKEVLERVAVALREQVSTK